MADGVVETLRRLSEHVGVVFRGEHGPIPQSSYALPDLLPTSMNPRVASENFTAEHVIAIVTFTGRNISALSRYPGEQEVTLLPEVFLGYVGSLRVDGLSGDVYIFSEQGDSASLPKDERQLKRLVADKILTELAAAPIEILSPGRFATHLDASAAAQGEGDDEPGPAPVEPAPVSGPPSPTAGQPAGDSPSEDELEVAISGAVHAGSDEWYESVVRHLHQREVFLHLSGGTPADAQPVMVTTTVGGREGWIKTFTTRSRPNIRYGGIVWEELVKMIKGNEAMPGVQLINDADDWIVLGRDTI